MCLFEMEGEKYECGYELHFANTAELNFGYRKSGDNKQNYYGVDCMLNYSFVIGRHFQTEVISSNY